ncbi:5-oxoprolinase subunit PxpB [Metabacillus sp. KIGAM252]|uniref:5-oxoprolinase subunit PxpB n=1 Tax=Metabacillus flavus TaxID=2823519 RepID=A0ABS5LGX9_9BACI|nr:5-oxoprolinase subunit PxpB [Metabacillus flavus]MBS2970010.1 5-oxoprolinase subunit PxpB [Metabacillus flavus]
MKRAAYYPISEQAMLVEFGQEISEELRNKIRLFTDLLDQQNFPWLVEYIPAFTNVTIIFDLLYFKENPGQSHERIQEEIENILSSTEQETLKSPDSEPVKIPVCYDEEFGMDLDEVANYNGLSKEEVITLHTEGIYPVYMIGFSPGFPYLGGMTGKIAAPRKEKPRPKIPAGSVGIAGTQTGVYPLETPGGWQIIGRTPLSLFDPAKEPPALLKAGDSVQFYRISKEEYNRLKES